MACITNEAVKALILPQRTRPAKAALDTLSREPFPRTAHILHSMFVQHATQSMHMSGHDSIGQHLAALSFKVMKRFNHHLTMTLITQQAFAVAFVEQHLQFEEACALVLLPVSQPAAGQRICLRGYFLPPCVGFTLNLCQDDLRDGVSEPECYEIDGTGQSPMRELSCIGREISARHGAVWIETREITR